MTRATALEVWGDPISHSLSPVLHRAAYAELGFDWTYGRRQVGEEAFAEELVSLGPEFRGLSCTMPLKSAAFRSTDAHDAAAEATGAVNTVLLTEGRRRGFNTDVGGIVRALADNGVLRASRARLLGAGATAVSALVALAEWGVPEAEIVARRPDAAASLASRAAALGVTATARTFDGGPFDDRELTVSTLPGGAALPDETAAWLAAGRGTLFDVVYGHGDTALTRAWDAAGAPRIGGEQMLLHQAVLQIRIFATGDPQRPLPHEERVLAVMRGALVGG